jgi:uridine phosphorylase
MTTLYLKADHSIAKNVILSGDPWRVETLAGILDDVRHVAFAREFNTYTGSYRGVPVTVSSTGIGAPSAAIAMEELYECGMEVAVRMGTVMALSDDLLGTFIVPVASMREEGTTAAYAPPGYPAVADTELLLALNEAVTAAGAEYVNGLNCTVDAFYTHMKESKLSKRRGLDLHPGFDRLRELGVAGLDMESSCVLTLGRLMGIRAAVVTLATVLEGLKSALQGQARTDAEALLCRVALDGIHRFARKDA